MRLVARGIQQANPLRNTHTYLGTVPRLYAGTVPEITVDFGLNDGGYREFSDQTFKPYMDGLQGMADQATAANIRTAWVTPQPLDNDEQGKTALTGYNQALEKFSEGVRALREKQW